MGSGMTGTAALTAVIASVLTAGLVLAASWWLDARQERRAVDADLRAMAGTLMAGVATARGALEVANASRENAERMHAMSLARTDRRAFTGTYMVYGQRLRRALAENGAPAEGAIPVDLIDELLLPAMEVLHTCAILGRNRLLLPEGECLSIEIIGQSMARCETAVLAAMDDAIVRPAEAGVLHAAARETCLGQPGLPVSGGGAA